LVLVSRRRAANDGWRALQGFAQASHIILLERPLLIAVLVSSVRLAVAARQRQYQIRDEMHARQQVERDLRRSEHLYRATFQAAPVGIAHASLEGRLLRFNDTLCQLTGYPAAELAEQKIAGLIHPDDLSADATQARRLRRGEIDRYSMDKRCLRKDGASRWMQLTISLLRDSEGTPISCIAVFQHIHDRKTTMHALRELLLNVVKHSGQREATIELHRQGANLAVAVQDSGQGFDPQVVEKCLESPESLGLFQIRERLSALGGRLDVRRTPGGGARFQLVLPSDPTATTRR
jgi:PAS domain S-box-containing protein